MKEIECPEEDQKYCNLCERCLPYSEFYLNKKHYRKTGELKYLAYCKECRKSRKSLDQYQHPEQRYKALNIVGEYVNEEQRKGVESVLKVLGFEYNEEHQQWYKEGLFEFNKSGKKIVIK